ncbi:MAG: DNA-directed RNA polymerase subunit L [Candidatus Bathyarchaeia archaeon]|nr:DNA-directed RNA polymerase subunit L [Candidatus Bathyarchaeota archaeon]
MRLRVLEREANKIVIEVEGEGHTLCNLLENVLLEDEDVEFASYNISHPLVAKPIITVRTKGNKRPEEALKEAVNKILQRGRELREEFEKAFKATNK